jgi:hypothetical protein
MVSFFGTRDARMAWLRWLPTILAFPVGGYLARALVGPADQLAATVVGGALLGAVLGTAQALALRSRVAPLPWIGATAVGLAVGVTLGSAAVDYGTGPADLAVQGAISGAVLGVAQLLVLRDRLAGAWRWVPLTALAWTLGWTVTRAAGIDVERHYYNFGLSGALVATILTGLLAVTIMGHIPSRRPVITAGAPAWPRP